MIAMPVGQALTSSHQIKSAAEGCQTVMMRCDHGQRSMKTDKLALSNSN